MKKKDGIHFILDGSRCRLLIRRRQLFCPLLAWAPFLTRIFPPLPRLSSCEPFARLESSTNAYDSCCALRPELDHLLLRFSLLPHRSLLIPITPPVYSTLDCNSPPTYPPFGVRNFPLLDQISRTARRRATISDVASPATLTHLTVKASMTLPVRTTWIHIECGALA